MTVAPFYGNNAMKFELAIEPEKVVEHRFGYAEVYLKLNGEKSRYKLILKNNKLIAIVKRNYKLIPHEMVEEVLGRITYLRLLDRVQEGGRCYWWYAINGRTDVGLLVENSVDKSLALGVRLFLVINDVRVPLLASKNSLFNVKKIHKKSANLQELPEIVGKMVEEVDKVKQYVESIFAKRAADYMNVWELLKQEIPEKYTRVTLAKLAIPGNKVTVGEIYRELAQKILSSPKTLVSTKMEFLKKLNDVLWIIGEVEAF